MALHLTSFCKTLCTAAWMASAVACSRLSPANTATWFCASATGCQTPAEESTCARLASSSAGMRSDCHSMCELQHRAPIWMHVRALHQVALALIDDNLCIYSRLTYLQARSTFPYYCQQAAVCVRLRNNALLPCMQSEILCSD